MFDPDYEKRLLRQHNSYVISNGTSLGGSSFPTELSPSAGVLGSSPVPPTAVLTPAKRVSRASF
jgi:hypothetical protein